MANEIRTTSNGGNNYYKFDGNFNSNKKNSLFNFTLNKPVYTITPSKISSNNDKVILYSSENTSEVENIDANAIFDRIIGIYDLEIADINQQKEECVAERLEENADRNQYITRVGRGGTVGGKVIVGYEWKTAGNGRKYKAPIYKHQAKINDSTKKIESLKSMERSCDKKIQVLEFQKKQVQNAKRVYPYNQIIGTDAYKSFVENYNVKKYNKNVDWVFLQETCGFDLTQYYNFKNCGPIDFLAIPEYFINECGVPKDNFLNVALLWSNEYIYDNNNEAIISYRDCYLYLTDEQKNLYHYLFYEKSPEEANNYLIVMADTINKAKGADMAAEFIASLDLDDNGKVEASLANAFDVSVEGLSDGIGNFISGLERIFETDGEITAEDYKKMIILQYLQENSTDYDFLYETTSSIGNMIPAIVTSAIVSYVATPAAGSKTASALMGLSAFGNAKNQALLNGHDLISATFYGVFIGASESYLGYLFGGIPNISKNTSSSFVKRMIGEGIEEASQTFVEYGLRAGLLGEDVNWDDFSGDALKAFVMGVVVSGTLQSGQKIMDITISGIKYDIDILKLIEYIDSHPNMSIEECFIKYLNLPGDINVDVTNGSEANLDMPALANLEGKGFDILKNGPVMPSVSTDSGQTDTFNLSSEVEAKLKTALEDADILPLVEKYALGIIETNISNAYWDYAKTSIDEILSVEYGVDFSSLNWEVKNSLTNCIISNTGKLNIYSISKALVDSGVLNSSGLYNITDSTDIKISKVITDFESVYIDYQNSKPLKIDEAKYINDAISLMEILQEAIKNDFSKEQLTIFESLGFDIIGNSKKTTSRIAWGITENTKSVQKFKQTDFYKKYVAETIDPIRQSLVLNEMTKSGRAYCVQPISSFNDYTKEGRLGRPLEGYYVISETKMIEVLNKASGGAIYDGNTLHRFMDGTLTGVVIDKSILSVGLGFDANNYDAGFAVVSAPCSEESLRFSTPLDDGANPYYRYGAQTSAGINEMINNEIKGIEFVQTGDSYNDNNTGVKARVYK